jgi:hypothetical protein
LDTDRERISAAMGKSTGRFREQTSLPVKVRSAALDEVGVPPRARVRLISKAALPRKNRRQGIPVIFVVKEAFLLLGKFIMRQSFFERLRKIYLLKKFKVQGYRRCARRTINTRRGTGRNTWATRPFHVFKKSASHERL